MTTYDGALGSGSEAEHPVLPGVDSVLEVVSACKIIDLVVEALVGVVVMVMLRSSSLGSVRHLV